MISIRSCAPGGSFWCHFGAPGGHFGTPNVIFKLPKIDVSLYNVNFSIMRAKKIAKSQLR